MAESVGRCENCGAALVPGAKFCAECGQPVRSRFCEQCGAKLAPGIKFCEECGSPVAEKGATPQVATPPYSQPPAEAVAGWQTASGAPPAWAPERETSEAPRPKARRRGRGCWGILLVLILLLLAVVAAAVLLGWVSYNSATGNLILFPSGVPFIATPTPLP